MDSTVMMFREMGGVNLDVDATFLIQLTVIVVTMLVLRKLIFQPYLRVATIRDELTTQTAVKAEETAERARNLAEEFEAKLQIAKQEALAEKVRLRSEGVRRKDELLDAASAEAQAYLKASKASLESELADVKAASGGLVDELSTLIANKILDRNNAPFSAESIAASESEEEVQP